MSCDFNGIVKAKREIYYNSEKNWGIYQSQVILTKEISEKISIKDNLIVIKGNMPQLRNGNKYYLKANHIIDAKFGEQFEIVCIANAIDQYPKDSASKRRILSELFTSNQIDAMYASINEPFDVFMNGDAEQLIKVKGCGLKTATLWTERFNDFIPLNKVYLELENYELTNGMIKKLLQEYKAADVVIDKVKSNPYCLCELNGIGWKTADKIALKGGLNEFSLERIESFILSYLDQQGEQGYSYVEPSELMAAIVENIGDAVPDFTLTEAIHSLDKKLFWNKDKTLIGLRRFWELENKIADEVIRLLNAPQQIRHSDYQELIKTKQEHQGWEYTEEQLEGIRLGLESNFFIITGGAGTGKSSIVDLLLSILGSDYKYAQTALSGRAAARLAEVTHKEGFTIHRLLGFPTGPKNKGKFLFNEENQLDYDVIIVDEISMLGGFLFYNLLRAIKSGSKVILLGDTGQLEAIGECNVAHDLLNCIHIPRKMLTKCHRQALKSAIITESKKVREGIPIISRGWVGEATLGELQDLTLDCYSDISNTYHKTLKYFTKCLKKDKNIMNIQVIAPVKNRGDACIYKLNLALQEISNPGRTEEIVVRNIEGMVYGIKKNDKVINTQNCYGASIAYTDDKETDVYNGNIGIVIEVNSKNNYMIIDFQDIGVVKMSNKELDNIELAYTVSVHKYQGSECKNVIIALDFSSYSLLTRELVYTAITRAKEHCVLIAQNKALLYAINNPATIYKKTFLADILNEKLLPKRTFNF